MLASKIIRNYFLYFALTCLLFLVNVSVASADTIIDNGDPGTSYTGTWMISGGADPYDYVNDPNATSIYSWNGATYTWTFTPSVSGNYGVSMWWTVYPSRSTSAPVSIQYSGGTANLALNQQVSGGQWNSLGTYYFQAGVSYKVTLSSLPAPLTVCADAVKFVYVSGGGGNAAPVANNDTATTVVGTPVTIDVLANDTDANGNIDPTTVAITSNPAHGTAVPQGDGTVQYTPIGGYSGTDTFGYTVKDTGGAESNAAVVSITVDALSGDTIIDNGNPGTSYTGTWSVSGGTSPYGANSLYSGGTSTYTWHAGLQSGTYDVYMWWTTYANRSTGAPVAITNSSGTQIVTVNQQQNGGMWNYLGTFSFDAAAGGTVKLSATGTTSETVCADAVKFVYVSGGGGNTAPVAVIDTISPNPALPGETVTFQGHGNDSDGTIKAYNWRSDKDGMLSDRASFSLSALSTGIHTIFFKVQDDQGIWSPEVSVVLFHLGCNSPVRIMPLGDSITYGIGEITYGPGGIPDSNLITGYRKPLFDSLSAAGYNIDFTGALQTGQDVAPPFDLDHQGIPGITAGEVAANVYNYLVAHPADIVLIHIGTNSLVTSAADVETILDEIDRYSKETTVVLARIIDYKTHNPNVTIFNNNVQAMALQRIAEGDKIILVDQEHALTYPDDMWDVVHPNNAGYGKMAVVWFDALDNILPSCGQFAPFIYTHPKIKANTGQPYSYKVGANGLPAPSFSLQQAPQGMTINSSTGLIRWTPSSSGNYTVSVVAGNGIGTSATQTFTVNVTTTAVDIIDNGDPRTSYTGTWMISGGANPYNYLVDPSATSLYSSSGAKYTWTFTPSVSGQYDVSMWWTVYASRSNSVPISIQHYGGTANLTLDQQVGGGQWNSLGTFYFQAGVSYKVTITAPPQPLTTCADAVKFVSLGGGLPADVVIDNGDAQTSYTGSWMLSGAPYPYDYINNPAATSLYSWNGATYTWTFTPVVSGNYNVSMWWTAYPSRSTNVPVHISWNTAQLILNQQVAGGQWNSLGTYYFQSGVSYKVTVFAPPEPATTCADAVKFVYTRL